MEKKNYNILHNNKIEKKIIKLYLPTLPILYSSF